MLQRYLDIQEQISELDLDAISDNIPSVRENRKIEKICEEF